MKKLLILSLGTLLFFSCKKQPYNYQDDPKNGNKKIDVCHREGNGSSHKINISINAWAAHQAHGDIRLDDQDGDGYVPNNACGFGQMGDCNDLNPAIRPGAIEICGNDVDENCNGQINENCSPVPAPLPLGFVTICTQVWTSANLSTSTYRNGDPIPQVTDYTKWSTLTTGAWCWYNNDSASFSSYGKLYNWYAVIDPRGLAPNGWHIPSAEEWLKLSNCLGGELAAGAAMKEIGTLYWATPNQGATNSSKFTALPAGLRYGVNGVFALVTEETYWWSTTQVSTTDASSDVLRYNVTNNIASSGLKTSGYSVRCIRN